MAEFFDSGYDRLANHIQNRRKLAQTQTLEIQHQHDTWNKINVKKAEFSLKSDFAQTNAGKYAAHLEHMLVYSECRQFRAKSELNEVTEELDAAQKELALRNDIISCLRGIIAGKTDEDIAKSVGEVTEPSKSSRDTSQDITANPLDFDEDEFVVHSANSFM